MNHMPRYARPLILLFTIAAAAVPARAQTRRSMTIENLLTAVRVGDPQLSPDGKLVLFTRTTTAMPAGKRLSEIWKVPADGSAAPAVFIQNEKSVSTPRFLPDGKRLVFIMNRDGAPQVYVEGIDGGAIRAVTSVSGGVQPPLVVSPDGKKIAFVSDAYPECIDDACNKRMREAAEADPVKVHTLTRLPFRHWNEWWEKVRRHIFITDIATGATRDMTLGDFDSPPHNYEDGAIAFSPDSREIAFVSKHNGDAEMFTTNHEIWATPVDRVGPVTKVTSNPAADFQPTFTPDGKSLIVRAQRRPGFEADRWYLVVYDRATGARRTVFETPDLSVDDYRLSPDGKTIWFQAEEKATANLYTVPLAGGVPKKVAQGGAFGEVQPGAGFAIASKSTLNAPADLFRVGEDGTVKMLTNENATWIRTASFEKPVSATVPGALGAPVQYWIVKPPQFDATKRYPVIFMIHGGPQGSSHDGWSFRWNPALWAAQGWIVIEPNPRGSTGFGQKFVDGISQDWCGKVMTDLDAVFNTVAKLPYADSTRMGVVGASYGGYAVDWIIGHTNRFKVAVSHDGVFNLESMSLATEELWFSDWEAGGAPWTALARRNYARCSPHLFVDKIRTPTLVITNLQDFRVPVDQGLQLFTSLRRNGVPSEGLVFENEGHWVLNVLDSKRWHETVFAWLKKYLGG
jgi:dipeptidyl aminopeptidase/acylaminoacyl peptidase